MEIMQRVNQAYSSLPLPYKEARNMALACSLEPLSEKPGCVTRNFDVNRNTLEMFISGGVNIFPAFFRLTEFLLQSNNPNGMYKFLHMAILLSKMNRKGGQINQGILEFSLPIVAAHVLYDPQSIHDGEYVLNKASEVLISTGPEDFKELWLAKNAGMEITQHGRGKGYHLEDHAVCSVLDYYKLEYEAEQDRKRNATGLMHNKQFIKGFEDIIQTHDALKNAKGKFSHRTAEAYNIIMSKPQNLGVGPGLIADFVAVSIYLELAYAKDREFIE